MTVSPIVDTKGTGDRLPPWARERGQHLALGVVSPRQTALLVVDLQQEFVARDLPFARMLKTVVVPRVNRLIAAARQSGMTVVFLRHTTGVAGAQALPAWQTNVGPRLAEMRARLVPGDPSHDVYDGLDRMANDPVVDKYRYSAFASHASDLDTVLRGRGIDTLLVCGAATNACCESTVRDANMIGYRTLVVSDATAALTDAEHDAALLNLALIFSDIRDTDGTVRLIEEARDC